MLNEKNKYVRNGNGNAIRKTETETFLQAKNANVMKNCEAWKELK